jgi:hypothetical protein
MGRCGSSADEGRSRSDTTKVCHFTLNIFPLDETLIYGKYLFPFSLLIFGPFPFMKAVCHLQTPGVPLVWAEWRMASLPACPVGSTQSRISWNVYLFRLSLCMSGRCDSRFWARTQQTCMLPSFALTATPSTGHASFGHWSADKVCMASELELCTGHPLVQINRQKWDQIDNLLHAALPFHATVHTLSLWPGVPWMPIRISWRASMLNFSVPTPRNSTSK